MINREELLEFAREFQLESNVVEKDYALGWLLAGIGSHPDLRDTWVFKGGTCLKKCFFETYRFSEDLDFTVRDPAHLDAGFLSGAFAEVAEWVTPSVLYQSSTVGLRTVSLLPVLQKNRES